MIICYLSLSTRVPISCVRSRRGGAVKNLADLYTVTNGIVKNQRPENSGTGTEMEPKWNQNRNRKNPIGEKLLLNCNFSNFLSIYCNSNCTLVSFQEYLPGNSRGIPQLWGGIQWPHKLIYARRFCVPCSRSVTI